MVLNTGIINCSRFSRIYNVLTTYFAIHFAVGHLVQILMNRVKLLWRVYYVHYNLTRFRFTVPAKSKTFAMSGNTALQGFLKKLKYSFFLSFIHSFFLFGARCSSVVRAFAHGAMGRRIDPSWWTH